MKRQDVRSFIAAGVQELASNYPFNSGRYSEITQSANNSAHPFVWLESLSTGTTFSVNGSMGENWNIIIYIIDKDKIDSTPEQYEAIVDKCDFLGQQLIHILDQNLPDSHKMFLDAISREPHIKKFSTSSTGIILTFTLIDFSPANVC